jgi:hypothetical protein
MIGIEGRVSGGVRTVCMIFLSYEQLQVDMRDTKADDVQLEAAKSYGQKIVVEETNRTTRKCPPEVGVIRQCNAGTGHRESPHLHNISGNPKSVYVISTKVMQWREVKLEDFVVL